MVKKDLSYKGKTLEELQAMDIKEFMTYAPSRIRRSLKRGFTDQQKKLLLKVGKYREGKIKKPIKTQCRNMVIIPALLGVPIQVYNGKEYFTVEITLEVLGKYLGELVVTRRKVEHSAPGIGATKSSSAMSVK